MTTRDEMLRILREAIGEALRAKGRPSPPLEMSTRVDGSLGLDSLDWAAVVVRMELETGSDPFAQGVGRELRTLSDIVELYAPGPS